jgi:iron complex transport system ATP-binding protein
MSARTGHMNEVEQNLLKIRDLYVGYAQHSSPGEGIVYGPLNTGINRPEMIGIIGRNGIGKSTLLRTMTGIQHAIKGTISIQGREISRISRSESARLISYVSTEAIHVQNLRVKELVSMGRFPYTNWFGKLTGDDYNIIDDSIELTGIAHLLEKSVYQLSDGERQKIMIARALAQDTPVIILDEPTAFLDLPARHETIRLLNNLSRHKNKLIIFSTHDLSIAMDEVDKLWLMTEDGLLEGAPEDLLMNQGFRKLFKNSDLDFDTRSLVFRFNRDLKKRVKILADEKYLIFTRKAMERIGYKTTKNEDTEYTITVIAGNSIPVWHVMGPGHQRSFTSIYQLTSFFQHEL